MIVNFTNVTVRVEISKCKAERIEMQQHQPPKARSKAADFQVHVTFTSQFPVRCLNSILDVMAKYPICMLAQSGG